MSLLSSLAKAIGSPQARRLLTLGIGVLGMALSTAAYFELRRAEESQARMAFTLQAEQHAFLLENNLRRRIDMARVLSAYYAGSHDIERREFHDFIEHLTANFDVIETMAWVQRVEGTNREAFEREIRAETNRDGIHISQHDAEGRIVPAPDRNEYFPLCYLEPLEVAEDLLAFDLATHAQSRELFDRARTTRRNVVAAMPGLIGGDKAVEVLCAVMAVYPGDHHSELGSLEHDELGETDRPASNDEPLGYVMANVRVKAFLDDIARILEPRKVDIWFYELLPKGERRALGFLPVKPPGSKGGVVATANGPGRPEASAAIWSHDFRLGGRRFAFVCTAPDLSALTANSWLPWFVLACGLIVTGLVAGYVSLLAERMSQSEMLASDQAIELEMMSQSSLNSVVVIDIEGRILHWNPAAARAFGYAAEEVLGQIALERLLAASDYAHMKNEVFAAALDGKPLAGWTSELTAVRRNSQSFPVEVSVAPFLERRQWRAVVVLCDITSRRLFEQTLKEDARVMRQLVDLHERERRLIAYEIHDGLAQQISAAIMRLQAYQGRADRNSAAAEALLTQSSAALAGALSEARRLISGLRPPILDEMGVQAAIDYLVAEWRLIHSVDIEFACDESLGRLAPPLETCVFRIVQESLANAVRHSGSDCIRVELSKADGSVFIDVRDWGKGFDPQNLPKGRFGVEGIRERVRLFDGTMAMETAPQKGVHLHVELPLVELAESPPTPPEE